MICVHNPPWPCTSLSADEVHDLVLTLTRNAGIRQEDLDEGQRMVTHNHTFKLEPTTADTKTRKSISSPSAVKTTSSYKLRLSYSNIPPPWIVVQSVCNVVPKTFCQVFHELCSLQRQEFKYRKSAVTSNHNKYMMYKLYL